jgi:hypothetical protein
MKKPLLAMCSALGITLMIPTAAVGQSAAKADGARHISVSRDAPTQRHIDLQNSLAALPAESSKRPRRKGPVSPARANAAHVENQLGADNQLGVDVITSTSLRKTETSGPRPRRLDFSPGGAGAPKLRIAVRKKNVRFNLEFKVVDDVFVAPSYLFGYTARTVQHPETYINHSLLVGMRFKFDVGRP